MKKTGYLLIIILLIGHIANAQYRENKKHFDHKSYTYQDGDLYDPAKIGFASVLTPGLGQIKCGEKVRGFSILAGYTGCIAVGYFGVSSVIDNISDGGNGNRYGLMAGIGSALGLGIWGIVDAVRVAKVNNLANRSQNKTLINFNVKPYIVNISAVNNKNNLSPGLIFIVNF